MNTPYPRLKVILGFSLAGGAVIGMVTFLPTALLSFDRLASFTDFFHILFNHISNAYAIGTLPAAVTGLWLAYRRCTQAKGDVGYAIAIGTTFPLINAGIALLAFFILDSAFLFLWGVSMLFVAPISAISAGILARIFLPAQ